MVPRCLLNAIGVRSEDERGDETCMTDNPRTSSMKYPLVIGEPNDWDIYDSLDAVQKQLEPIDVLEGVYIGYDREGRLLRLIANDNFHRSPISVEYAEATPTHQAEMQAYLIRFFESIGASSSRLSQVTLPELIEGLRHPQSFLGD